MNDSSNMGSVTDVSLITLFSVINTQGWTIYSSEKGIINAKIALV